ncbi:ZIP family metal transporter [Nodosilinea nodulosa]|uniref:ZIP family metal transporter n=1 Tax=Nodosilinea nodulosa TaxID=416001 RepID=UPI0002FF6863|nr:zinc transporter [Nodosilinea nodulosa]
MLTVLVVLVVSGALLLGAAWGIYGSLSKSVEGFIVALAGGALIISAVLELIEPSTKETNIWAAFALVLVGATVFTGLDYLVKKKWGSSSGGGLLAAITLDGIPENLALGVALIGAGPLQVAALSGSIFLSNLPEAAGGAKAMARGNRSKGKVLFLWGMTAVLLSAAALAGNFFLAGVSKDVLALIRCFAGGAVIASLAIEVFPKAFKEDAYLVGIATTIGLILALYLDQLN